MNTKVSAELKIVSGKHSDHSASLDGPDLYIGRSRKCQLVLKDRFISREHVKVSKHEDSIMLEDLGSAHGTFLNGRRLRGQVSLTHGDVIQLGDTMIEFSCRKPAPSDMIEQAGAGSLSDEAGSQTDATRFSPDGLDPETRYYEQPIADPEEDHDLTHVLENDETRLLNISELGRNLRAGNPSQTTAPSRKWFYSALTVFVLIIVSTGAMLMRPSPGIRKDHSGLYEYEVAPHFTLKLPSGWKQTTSQSPVLFERNNSKGMTVGTTQIHVDEDEDYQWQSLPMAFSKFLNLSEKQWPEYQLIGEKSMMVNGSAIIFFAYSNGDVYGKGLYTVTSNTAIAVQCECDKSLWPLLKNTFTGILSSYQLKGKQTLLIIPDSDDLIRVMALKNPKQLLEQARHHKGNADELLKHSRVRPENLFRAIQEYQKSLQAAAALTPAPSSFRETAKSLARATRAFQRGIQTQRYAIRRAMKLSDFEAAYWEASMLMNMIPDKTHPDYQYAYKASKFYAEKRKP